MSYIIMPESYLSHAGTKGMRWKLRRYQNDDGTYTEEGKARRRAQYQSIKKTTDKKSNGNVDKTTEKNIKSIFDGSKNITDKASGLLERSSKKNIRRVLDKKDLSQMSNDDLQKTISRLSLERQYKNLVAEDVYSGRQYVADRLKTVGELVTIAGSAVTVAIAMKKLFEQKTKK